MTTFFHHTFNVASGTPDISTLTPEVGAAWLKATGQINTSSAGRAYNQSTSVESDYITPSYGSGVVNYSQVARSVNGLGSTGAYFAIWCRIDASLSPTSGHQFGYQRSNNRWTVYSTATGTLVASASDVTGPADGSDWRLDTNGTLGILYVNGIEVIRYASLDGGSTGSRGALGMFGGTVGAVSCDDFISETLLTNYTLTASTGSFSLTGESASLKLSRRLVAAQGSFTLTGQNANLARVRALQASTGTFALNGQSANFVRSLRLPAAQGSFVLTGESAALKRSRILPAAFGSFTLTGESANLAKQYRLPASYGSFSLTGESASLLRNRRLAAAFGSFVLTGEAATLKLSRILSASNGTFVLTGFSASLVKSGNYALQASTGFFALTGEPANLRRSLILRAAFGSFSVTGESANLKLARRIALATGYLTLTGYDADLVIAGVTPLPPQSLLPPETLYKGLMFPHIAVNGRGLTGRRR